MRRTAPVLLAARSNWDWGRQQTALMNWLKSWGVAGVLGGGANRRCARGFDIAWWYTNTCTVQGKMYKGMGHWGLAARAKRSGGPTKSSTRAGKIGMCLNAKLCLRWPVPAEQCMATATVLSIEAEWRSRMQQALASEQNKS